MRVLPTCCAVVLSACLTVVSLGAAGAQSDRPIHVYWSCHTGQAGNPVYVTDVWEARALASEVHAGFVKLLADKYNYKGPVFCSMGEVLSATGLEKHKADQEQLYKHYGTQGLKIVRTGWTLAAPGQNPGAATAAAPAAAPAMTTKTFWSVCRASRYSAGNGPYDTYISDVFLMNQADVGKQTKAFGEFLSTSYGSQRDNPQCNVNPSEDMVRGWLKTWTDEAAKGGGKLITTGWKFTQ